MALLTQVIPRAGAAITFTPATLAGDTFATGDGLKLLVKNDAASAVTATLGTPGLVDGDLAIADRAVTVAPGTIRAVPLADRYRDPATGLATVTYSSVTTVSVAVIR